MFHKPFCRCCLSHQSRNVSRGSCLHFIFDQPNLNDHFVIVMTVINKNPYLFGPGPVKRIPKGAFTQVGRMPPLQGFSVAAAQAIGLALVVSFGYKYFFGDPQIKKIENYYKENPPR